MDSAVARDQVARDEKKRRKPGRSARLEVQQRELEILQYLDAGAEQLSAS
jgi:hypothetical protein